MDLETAYDIIESCHGFDDETSAVGEAWMFVKEQISQMKKDLDCKTYKTKNKDHLSKLRACPIHGIIID